MSYFEAAGHWAVYAAVIAGVLYIAVLGGVFFRRAYSRALKIGFTKQHLRKAVKTAAANSLIPAITVLVGLFTIVPLLGLPLSWWRLSIVGSTAYEIMAADIALGAVGAKSAADSGAEGFVLVMFVMAVGIIGGLVLAPLFSGRIQKGVLRIKLKDRRWSAYSAATYMTTIAIVLTIPTLIGFSAATMTLLTALAVTALLKFAAKKTGSERLSDFSFITGMLSAMASSVFWTWMLGRWIA
ncbi:MAG: DUF5058 family protein [Oscillospiraceae bacterium]|jgi:hypothetical protein|nr:DUF5058 family protein [Oscillospiraceae bacterium]